jgi:hypothetical protein
MSSRIDSMVNFVRIWIHISTEQPRRYTAPPHSLEPSVVLLLLYYKQTVTVIVLLPSAYYRIGSDSQQSSPVLSVRFELSI